MPVWQTTYIAQLFSLRSWRSHPRWPLIRQAGFNLDSDIPIPNQDKLAGPSNNLPGRQNISHESREREKRNRPLFCHENEFLFMEKQIFTSIFGISCLPKQFAIYFEYTLVGCFDVDGKNLKIINLKRFKFHDALQNVPLVSCIKSMLH